MLNSPLFHTLLKQWYVCFPHPISLHQFKRPVQFIKLLFYATHILRGFRICRISSRHLFSRRVWSCGKDKQLIALLGSQSVKGPSRMATPKTRERAQLVMYLMCSCEKDVDFNPQNQWEVGSGSTRLQSQCSYCKISGEKGVPGS